MVDLYKHWLELILKYNGAYYLITGAMVSYSLQGDLRIRVSLILPIIIGIGLTKYARGCIRVMKDAQAREKYFKDKLNVEIVPELCYVIDLLRWSSIFFILVVVGLSVLLLGSAILALDNAHFIYIPILHRE